MRGARFMDARGDPRNSAAEELPISDRRVSAHTRENALRDLSLRKSICVRENSVSKKNYSLLLKNGQTISRNRQKFVYLLANFLDNLKLSFRSKVVHLIYVYLLLYLYKFTFKCIIN